MSKYVYVFVFVLVFLVCLFSFVFIPRPVTVCLDNDCHTESYFIWEDVPIATLGGSANVTFYANGSYAVNSNDNDFNYSVNCNYTECTLTVTSSIHEVMIK